MMEPPQEPPSSSPQPADQGRVELDGRGLPLGYRLDPAWEQTPRRVKASLDDGDDLLLIDCRTPNEHSLARIEGAKLMPLHTLPWQLEELKKLRHERVVIYCHHGVRSAHMTKLLREQGMMHVWSMAGGIDLWSIDIDPDVPRY